MIEIDGYRVIRPLGHGGMSTVLLAEQHSLGRKVALKLLLPGLAQDAEYRARFIREARLAASLHHPNIVAIHEVGECRGQAFMAMAYEAGGTLADRLDHPMPSDAVLKVLRDVAVALEFAHQHGVVHRDIKPENILMRRDGGCLLSDFGIAFSLAEGRALTREGVSLGTPDYMSPEQLRGEPIDGRSDLYSLGVVLFQLCAGRLPYPGSDGWAIGLQHLHSTLPQLPPEHQRLQSLLVNLMAKNPAERLQSAGEVIRWIDVLLSGQTLPTTTALASLPHTTRPGWRLRTWTLAAAVLVVASLALWGWQHWPVIEPPLSADSAIPNPEASIAVLPFADLSPAADQGYLADGIADELINALGGVKGLRVSGRTSSFSFKNSEHTLTDIGRQLGVSHVLEGSVRREGSRLRVTTQLINAGNGYQLWNASFDRDLTDVLPLQREIAQAVAASLQLRLAPTEGVTSAARERLSTTGYHHYLLGREFMRRATAEDYLRAVEQFKRVTETDPHFAPGYAEWVQAEVASLQYVDKIDDPEQAQLRALRAADTAIGLDPDLAQAYAARATLRFTLTWDWAGADQDFQRALELNPTDSESHRRYGLLLAVLGRLPEAIAATRTAIDLDPLSSAAWNNLGYFYNASGDLDGARSAFERALLIAPGRVSSLFNRGVTELLAKRPQQASVWFAQIPEGEQFRLLGESMAAHALGEPTQAQQLLQAVEDLPSQSPFWLAAALAQCGETERSLQWLSQAVIRRDYFLKQLGYEPLLVPLRSETRYRAILQRLGLAATQ